MKNKNFAKRLLKFSKGKHWWVHFGFLPGDRPMYLHSKYGYKERRFYKSEPIDDLPF